MRYPATFTLLQNLVPSFVWHQLQDILVIHGQARTISIHGDVKIDLRIYKEVKG